MNQHDPIEPTPAFADDLQSIFGGDIRMKAPQVDAAIAGAVAGRAANLRRAKLIRWSFLPVSAAAAALVLIAIWPSATPPTPSPAGGLLASRESRQEAEMEIASTAKPEAQMALADSTAPAESLGRMREMAKQSNGGFSAALEMDALAKTDPRDIDGNARIDILDAFALARAAQAGKAPAAWDQNGDGVVNGADADVIARIAVALDGKGAAG